MENIEQEFIQSWVEMEEYFKIAVVENEFDLPIIYKTIKELRKLGFDSKFRAGQSLYSFIISRSKKWGLTEGQPSIKLAPGMNLWSHEGGTVKVFVRIINSPNLDISTTNPIESTKFWDALKALEKQPIN